MFSVTRLPVQREALHVCCVAVVSLSLLQGSLCGPGCLKPWTHHLTSSQQQLNESSINVPTLQIRKQVPM